jgi:hypothetical protein
MKLDVIVVIVLVVLWFGGLGFLAWKSRRQSPAVNPEVAASDNPTEQQPKRNQAAQRSSKKRE